MHVFQIRMRGLEGHEHRLAMFILTLIKKPCVENHALTAAITRSEITKETLREVSVILT
jgi:hypothetical protein